MQQPPGEFPQGPQPYYQQQHPPQQGPYMPPPMPQYQPPEGSYMPPMPQYQQPYPQQYPPQQAPMQQPYAQGMPAMPPMQPVMAQQVMQTNVNVNVQQNSGPGFFVRALYFLFIGWWAGLFWLEIGFALCALIVTLPVGLIMLNRLPQIMTLRRPGSSTSVNVSTTNIQQSYGGSVMVQNINVNVTGTQQYSFLIRALYYIFIGCWAGYAWANLAYLCCLTIILLPIGVMMFDRLPAVLTLRRN